MMGSKSNYKRGGKIDKLGREKELIVVSAFSLHCPPKGPAWLGWLSLIQHGVIVLT